jgi:predicted nucleic acid-binding protein
MIVLDASAAVDFLLHLPAADAITARMLADPTGLAAPHLIDAEVGQVLRRFVLKGQLDADHAAAALRDLRSMPIARYDHTPFLERAFELRDNLTFYDALYLALAESVGAPLLTRDAALAAAPGHRARVEVF